MYDLGQSVDNLSISQQSTLEGNGMLGAGTSGDPWQIATIDDLEKVGRDETYALNHHYILTADLDFADKYNQDDDWSDWNGGNGWVPIETFTGTFDGQFHTIRNLFCITSGRGGLFDYINGSGTVVRRLYVLDAEVEGGDRTGIIAGQARNDAVVEDCYTSGTVQSDGAGTSGSAGGVTGRNSTISDIPGDTYRCGSSATVTALGTNGEAGGVVGGNVGYVVDCYSTGDVSAPNGYAGGVVGLYYRSGDRRRIERSYAVGSVSGATTGGVVGYRDGSPLPVNDSFWDTETTGQATSDGGTGKTTAEMQDIDTYTDTATEGLTTEWDMLPIAQHDGELTTAVWYIDDGVDYPRLWFELEESGEDVDNLTAQDIITGAPEISQPTLGQTHILTAQDIVTAPPAISQPTLSQTHVLTAQDIVTGAPEISQPSLTAIGIVELSGASTSAFAAAASLSVVKSLSATSESAFDAEAALTVDEPSVVELGGVSASAFGAAGSLTVAKLLGGTSDSAFTAAASLDVAAPAVLLGGVSESAFDGTGTLTLVKPLSGTSESAFDVEGILFTPVTAMGIVRISALTGMGIVRISALTGRAPAVTAGG